MKQLFSSFKGYYKELILGPIFKLTEAIFELFIPILMANIIDIGIKNGDIRYILQRGGLMLLLGVLGLAAALTCQYFAALVAHGFGRSLRDRLFRHVLSLSNKETDAIGTNSLITRLTNDVTQVQTGVNMFIRLAIRAPFLAIGSIVMAMTINFKISIIFLVSTPLIIWVLYIIMHKTIPYYTKIQKKQDRLNAIAGENLAGVRVIRAFSRQEQEVEDFKTAGNELSDIVVRVGKISAALNPITYIIVNFAIVLIVWVGANFAFTGDIEAGKIIALVNYMTQTLLALIVLANLIVLFTRATASAKRVVEIFKIQPGIQGAKETLTDQKTNDRVNFSNVTFAYTKGSEAALQNINFTVTPGQTVGIIGGTGSGKSTIVNLLMRYYDVDCGDIFIDGVSIKNYTLEDLRAKIGLVPQTAMLFNGTIRDNLKLGKQNATDEELWQALTTAQGAEFVEKMPSQLDTIIEENGKNLSGGQKQRLTIARALVKQPEILILDDSASALDFATDAALRKALKTQTSDMTVFMISQRASTIKNADQILVLDDGVLVGVGTHETLLKDCEVYHEICVSQKLISEGEAK